jgi:YbbR domain-containing protein
VFLFFLTISTIFWFLNALSKEYVTNLSFPVKYEKFPPNKILVSELPSQITLKVNSFGFTILQYKLSISQVPIIFNLEDLQLHRFQNVDSSKYYLLTSATLGKIENQLGTSLKILEIQPDSLIFDLEQIGKKKVPIVSRLQLNFIKQYTQKGKTQLLPESVTVAGPISRLDSIHYVNSEPIVIEGVNKTITVKINLVSIKGTNFSESEVQVTVPVERFTEAEIRVPIEILNLPNSLGLKIFPSQVNISCMVALSDYELLDAKRFRAVVDFSSIAEKPGSKLKVKIVDYPSNIISFKYYPKNVDYILEK